MIDRLCLVDISKVKILDVFNSNEILLMADDAWQIAKHVHPYEFFQLVIRQDLFDSQRDAIMFII